MTIIPTKVYRGPFTSPRRPVVDQQKSLIVGEGCSLADRFLYLARTKHTLADCQNLPELQARIFELAFKNFTFSGKSLIYAGFWFRNEFTALTVPQERPPFPQNAEIGREAIHPFQPELIQEAKETKDIVRGGSEAEAFLAIPLVSDDRSKTLGILLLSNRLSYGRKPITEDDIEVARAFGEVVSEALAHFS